MGGPRILSDPQIEVMTELREQGLSYRLIAEHFTKDGTPINPKTIRWQCLRVGARKPGEPHGHRGKHSGFGKSFTAEEDALLLELEAQGLKWAEIGRRLGRAPNTCYGRVLTLASYDNDD